jgi:preprotein translocase subunit SecF
MELIKQQTKLDFLGKRRYALFLSGALLIISLGSTLIQGLQLGIDFTGGTLLEVRYPESADLRTIRSVLGEAGFPDAQVQHFGNAREVLVRIAPREGVNTAEISSEVLRVLQGQGGDEIAMQRVEFVGPQVGDELTEDGGLAVIYALAGILIYVAFRFEYRFAAGAVAALAHDVILTVGFFSMFRIEFDLTVLAAILAVIGYSLNDTIVVFDRIRENFRVVRRGTTEEVMNRSINQTLSRTLMTSFTTLLVLFALLLLGGEIMRGFSIALIVGVVVGTYSSIYVASTSTLALGVNRSDLLPKKEEKGADITS